MTVRLITGDSLHILPQLEADGVRVQTVVTSPPYYGLRAYNVPPTSWPSVEFCAMPEMPPLTIEPMNCCLGLEDRPWAYIGHMVLIFRALRGVLRDDGTVWLNIGDSYAGRGGQSPQMGPIFKGKDRQRENVCLSLRGQGDGLKEKDLIGIPWMLAFALRQDGWYLRQDIIWAKPNPMPESVSDRCTKSHEYIFLLSKSPKYFCDMDAISEPVTQSTIERMAQDVEQKQGSLRVPGKMEREKNPAMKAVLKKSGNKERKPASARGVPVDTQGRSSGAVAGSVPWEGNTRNKRTVWTVATVPYKGAHFATFPPDLIEPCILAGTSEHGCCTSCGAPWVRDVERIRTRDGEPAPELGSWRSDDIAEPDTAQGDGHWRYATVAVTKGWVPSCACGDSAGFKPCTVLDLFGGAGTTGLVADRLQRDAVLIDLNPEYTQMQDTRIAGDSPLFAQVQK